MSKNSGSKVSDEHIELLVHEGRELAFNFMKTYLEDKKSKQEFIDHVFRMRVMATHILATSVFNSVQQLKTTLETEIADIGRSLALEYEVITQGEEPLETVLPWGVH